MTPEEIVSANEEPVCGQTNEALKDYQRPGFGRGSTHRRNGVNAALPDALFGAVDTDHYIQTEKAWHRRAVDLSIQGFEIKEICNLLGYGRGQVETVLKQPWAQERIIEASKKSVADEMKAFLEAEVMPTLQFVKLVRDDPAAKYSDRLSAGEKLLERFLGKAVQPMTNVTKEVESMTNAELAAEAQTILERERNKNS